MREIADKVGAILMADIAHISGLVATGNAPNVFDYCQIVTTTTHKTLRGPRGAIVFALQNYNDKNLISAVHEATFPGFQGGPHNHTIAAIATALKEANSSDFKTYADQVVKNAKHLASCLLDLGYNLFTDGTDNHIILLNLRDKNIDGAKVDHLLTLLGISVNKNTIKGDLSAFRPSGIRLGSPPMTSRDAKEQDFAKIAKFIDIAIQYAINANKFKKVSEFNEHMGRMIQEDAFLIDLKKEIQMFAEQFPFNNLKIE
jgi:glycine hydroxymethyltransferase